jgi:sporulation protein YlmC with PRC-barrel domain
MGRVRIVLFVFGIAALTSICASPREVVHADQQQVGVTKASNLIGTQVTNLQGKNLGEIKDLVVNWRGGGYIEYAVLSFGGFLGLGDKYFAVPWEAMVLSSDKERFILNVREERLKNAPGFDKDNWPDMSRAEWAIAVYQFYDLDPTTSKPASRFSAAEVSQTMKGEVGMDFKNTVREALDHAIEAESAGKQGKPEALLTHAHKSLDAAKRAQRSGHNERLNEGVYALGEAMNMARNNRPRTRPNTWCTPL